MPRGQLSTFLGGIVQSAAWDSVKALFRAAGSQQQDYPERLVRAASAAERRLYALYPDDFPRPSDTFLHRRSNVEAIVRSLNFGEGPLRLDDLDPTGFGEQPPAERHHLQAFLDLLREEAERDHELGTMLVIHDTGRRSESIDEKLTELVSRVAFPQSDLLTSSSRFDAFCTGLDSQLLGLVRAIDEKAVRVALGTGDVRLDGYRALVAAAVDRKGLKLDYLLDQLAKPDVVQVLAPRPADTELTVEVGHRCNRVTFEFSETSLAIDSAELLWDCSCQGVGATSDEAGVDAECPIHNSEVGEEVSTRFRGGLVDIRYRGLSILWRNRPEFWPPSADAFHLAEDLIALDGLRGRLLDLGCGSGFLGIVLSATLGSFRSVTFSDWLMTPTVWAAYNWHRNSASLAASPRFELGLGFDWASSSEPRPWDVVVCNPPYLPLPEDGAFRALGLSSTVAGTELLEEAVRRGASRLSSSGRLFVSFSNVARPEAEAAARSVGRSLVAITEEERWVPFRVPRALEDPVYMRWLAGRGLRAGSGRHAFLHDVRTFELVPH